MDNVEKKPPMISLIVTLFSNIFAALPSSRSNHSLKSSSERLFPKKDEFNSINANNSSEAKNKFGILTGRNIIIDCSVSMKRLNKLVGGRLMAIWCEKENTENGFSSVFLFENCEVKNATLSECDVNDNCKNELNRNYKVKRPKCEFRGSVNNGFSLGECSTKHYEKKGPLVFPSEVGNPSLPKSPLKDFNKNGFLIYLYGLEREFPKFPPNLWSRNEVLDYLAEHEEDSVPVEEDSVPVEDDDEYPTGTGEEMIFTIDDIACPKEDPADQVMTTCSSSRV